MERIQFRCPNCSKALAIDSQHAGKQVACPDCGTHLAIPAASAATSNPVGNVPPASTQPVAPPNPFAIDSPVAAPNAPAQSPYAATFPPADASPSGGNADTRATPSMGKSIGGLLVAAVVAGVFSVVWLIVAAISGYELGILAWAMGGAVGLVAGAIGRNPSPVYCGLAATIAVMSVLAAKGIMVLALMALSWGADFAMELADFSPEQEKFLAVTADQMLVDGEFKGMEKQYAEAYVASYFSGGDVYDVMTDEMYDVSEQVDLRVETQLGLKTPEEKEQLCAAARERHPEWIEDYNHYLAIVDEMQSEEGTLSAELAAHAKYELAAMDYSWDDEYYDSVSADELTSRQQELRKMAAERIKDMDEPQLDQAVRDALERHLEWNPYPDAHNALLEKMHGEGVFSGPLAEHAKATIEYEMTADYPDYFDEVDDDDFQKRDEEVRGKVNEKLLSMDIAARDSLVEDAMSRYPDWQRVSMTAEEAQQEMDQVMEELGTDGTLRGNFLAVFSVFDLLWLFLGATTAFGTAMKYGSSA